MLFNLSNLNSNLALTLGYLNPALNKSALAFSVNCIVSNSDLGGYYLSSSICIILHFVFSPRRNSKQTEVLFQAKMVKEQGYILTPLQ